VLLNGNLQTEQNKDFILRIKTEGKVVPENAMIFIDGESYFMENSKAGEFQFKIAKRISDVVFHVEGNAVSSEEYQLKVVAVPTIANFEMQLNYRMKSVVNGSSNAIIPGNELGK
jgi:hypothetical protein